MKAKKLKDKYKKDYTMMMEDGWSKKPMHGNLSNHLEKEYIDIQVIPVNEAQWTHRLNRRNHNSSTRSGSLHQVLQ